MTDRTGQTWEVRFDERDAGEAYLVLRVTPPGEWLDPPRDAGPEEMRELDEECFRYDALRLSDGAVRPGFLCEGREGEGQGWESHPLMRRVA